LQSYIKKRREKLTKEVEVMGRGEESDADEDRGGRTMVLVSAQRTSKKKCSRGSRRAKGTYTTPRDIKMMERIFLLQDSWVPQSKNAGTIANAQSVRALKADNE
jgi:hypothetical protein